VATGGVHLDGLADTADALAAPSPDLAERARTDPRVGAGGVSAIALDVGLSVACLSTLVARDSVLAAAAIVVAATISRSAAPVAALVSVRAGGGEAPGAGAWFAGQVGRSSIAAVLVTSAVVTSVATVVTGPTIALGAAWGVIAGAALAVWIVMRRGQLDGDGYGAIVELTFLAVLTGIAVAGSLA
jgi:adenosylcobinamide-GDP ribazoletransferase